jgi:hypothetical protein
MRLPIFWPDRPAVWFAQVEAQFELAAITRQKTKFNYVVSQLNQQQAAEVEDIITTPLFGDPDERIILVTSRILSNQRASQKHHKETTCLTQASSQPRLSQSHPLIQHDTDALYVVRSASPPNSVSPQGGDVGASHIEHFTELLMALLIATTLCW